MAGDEIAEVASLRDGRAAAAVLEVPLDEPGVALRTVLDVTLDHPPACSWR
jgi:hypothetical protein